MPFNSLGLDAGLLAAVRDQGYTHPTPVQQQAIPAVLSGSDILACAQTGTGKTAGFTLPILQRLDRNAPSGKRRRVRCLILTPTRELAMQVGDSVRTYGRHLPLKCSVIFGGVKIGPQIAHLRHGVDIVVATPGRLLDHVSQGTIDLSAVEILVLDEADRMLDMGFIRDIRRIVDLLPEKRQTLLFSATLATEIRRLAESVQRDPVRIDVSPERPVAANIDQTVYHVTSGEKRAALSHLVHSGEWHQVLVFTRTKHRANRVARHLEDAGILSAVIHGNKSQGARTRALDEFKSGKARVLVATDIAARGLDIEQLPCVVNFELPNVPEDYVHRIGRTGRAGMSGEALSLIAPDELGYLRSIERLLGKRIPRGELGAFSAPTPDPRPERVERSDPDGRREHRRKPGRDTRQRTTSSRDSNRPLPGGDRPSSANAKRRARDNAKSRESRPANNTGSRKRSGSFRSRVPAA